MLIQLQIIIETNTLALINKIGYYYQNNKIHQVRINTIMEYLFHIDGIIHMVGELFNIESR